jgi:Gluconate 2-dehydrogenase subunit 3
MSSPQNRVKLTRRSLLKAGLWGGAITGLTGLGLGLQKTALVSGDQGLLVLSPEEYAVLFAFCDRLCPALPGFPGARELGVARQVDQFMAAAPADERDGFKLALRIFEHPLTGALFAERVSPFTRLSAEAQDRVMRAWRGSAVSVRRIVFAGVSGLASSLYWGDPRTWPRTGYAGPPELSGLRQAYADNLVDFSSLRASPASRGT